MSKQLNLLVGLDLSPMDDYLLSFLGQHAPKITKQPIKILHTPINDHEPHDALEAQILQKLPKTLANSEVMIKTGNPEKELELACEAMKIDVVILGKKPDPGNHMKTKKLTEKAKSSLLLLPAKKDYQLDTVYIALDFSDYDLAILKEAQKITKELGVKLKGIQTFQVPSGYHKTGKDHKEFAKEMEENARDEASLFFKHAGTSIEMTYVYEENQNTSQCIAKFVKDNPVDLLIMGSKGRTNAASVIHGSVAKEVTKEIDDTPMLILKIKDENMDAFEAIKEV